MDEPGTADREDARDAAIAAAAGLRVILSMSHLSIASGGLAESVPGLAEALRAIGIDARIVGLRDDRAGTAPGFAAPHVHALPPTGPRGFGYGRGVASTVAELKPDVIDTQHLWMYPSLVALRQHRRTGVPLVITPRGMLDPWSARRRTWKKRLARWAFEDAHMASAACFRALNAGEAEAIRAYGIDREICVVPNGIDLPDTTIAPPEDGQRTLLFLGRLDPKKGIAELLTAWVAARAAGELSDWRLEVAGAGEPAFERQLRQMLPGGDGAGAGVHFLGDLRGAEKANAFRRASAFVLPSHGEGLPMSVLEAWSNGRAVFVTDACNLPEAFPAGAAARIVPDAAALADTLPQLLASPPERLAAMGAAGRDLVRERFSRGRMARDMARVYAWVAGRGPRPEDLMHPSPSGHGPGAGDAV